MSYRGIVPDFVVVPDIVAGWLASLAWSAFWRDTVPVEFRAYLAVQDGMTVADVVPHLPRYHGIFVGGSLRWNWRPVLHGPSWHVVTAWGATSAA
jgi:hypothetical protein